MKISQMNTKMQPKIKIIEIKKMLRKSLNFKFLIKSNLLKCSDGCSFAGISLSVSAIHLPNKPYSMNCSILNNEIINKN